MQKDILKKKGERAVLLGNEGIIRGALEAGVRFVASYPGTPASEIGNIFYELKKAGRLAKNIYFEFSVNEKIAMEAAAAASFCGLRSLAAMKNFGLNVASDFLYPLVYSGVKGGMVIAAADDPSCWSSAQSEDNSRGHVLKAHLPCLEPATPKECRDFTKLAFKLSEKFKIPIMIRETTRVALQAGPVGFGAIKKDSRKAKFVKNPKQFVTMPPRVLQMHKELLVKIEKIREFAEKSPLNPVKAGRSKIGLIASGVCRLYAEEALKQLNLDLPVLNLGFFYPLPEKKIKNFVKKLKQVLVVEELEPYVEKEVERLAKEANPKLKISGKNLLSEVGEIKPENVVLAVAKLTGTKPEFPFKKHLSDFQNSKAPLRNPRFCPGCPYNLVYSIIKKAAPKNTIFGGEIGCYMLAHYPPYEMQDYLFCMGSDISIAHGIRKASGQKPVVFVGDSSFFHAGIPPLINAAWNGSNPLVVILQNETTAMTGHQPHPGVKGMDIEKIVRACGVNHLKVVDPAKVAEFEAAVREFLKKDEISVIIAKHPCIFVNPKS